MSKRIHILVCHEAVDYSFDDFAVADITLLWTDNILGKPRYCTIVHNHLTQDTKVHRVAPDELRVFQLGQVPGSLRKTQRNKFQLLGFFNCTHCLGSGLHDYHSESATIVCPNCLGKGTCGPAFNVQPLKQYGKPKLSPLEGYLKSLR